MSVLLALAELNELDKCKTLLRNYILFLLSKDTVDWRRSDGRPLSERARFSYDGNMTFTMTIRSVRKQDRGEYLCNANNHLVPSRNNTKEAVLKVNCESKH